MTVRLTLSAEDFHMQMCQAARSRKCKFDHAFDADGVAVQVVEQGAVLVVVRHQPELRPRPVV